MDKPTRINTPFYVIIIALFIFANSILTAANKNQVNPNAANRGSVGAVKMLNRAPKQFKPFKQVDLKTNKKIKNNEILTLPNGKRISAAEYYQLLNQLENQFNQMGYSLRDPANKVTIQRSVPKVAISQQQSAIMSSHSISAPKKITRLKSLPPELAQAKNTKVNRTVKKPLTKPQKKATQLSRQQTLRTLSKSSRTTLQKSVKSRTQLKTKVQTSSPVLKTKTFTQMKLSKPKLATSSTAGTMAPVNNSTKKKTARDRLKSKIQTNYTGGTKVYTPPAKSSAKTISKNKTWEKSVGDKSIFAAQIKANVGIVGSISQTKFYANAQANGWLFDRKKELLNLTGSVISTRIGVPNKASVILKVAGKTVLSPSITQANFIDKSINESASLDVSASLPFYIGPININVKFGAKGKAGLKFRLKAEALKATAEFGPFIESKVYAQVDANIVIAGAGAEANLILLNDNLKLAGEIGLKGTVLKPELYYWYSAFNEITAMKGNLKLFAYVYVPKVGIPPWKKKTYEHEVASWTGISARGYVFKQDGVTASIGNQLMAPATQGVFSQ